MLTTYIYMCYLLPQAAWIKGRMRNIYEQSNFGRLLGHHAGCLWLFDGPGSQGVMYPPLARRQVVLSTTDRQIFFKLYSIWAVCMCGVNWCVVTWCSVEHLMACRQQTLLTIWWGCPALLMTAVCIANLTLPAGCYCSARGNEILQLCCQTVWSWVFPEAVAITITTFAGQTRWCAIVQNNVQSLCNIQVSALFCSVLYTEFKLHSVYAICCSKLVCIVLVCCQ